MFCVLFLAISCGHPGVPVHGKINSYVFSYNSSVEYSCNPGYTIVGPKKRVCQANQTWTGSLPRCMRKLFALTFTFRQQTWAALIHLSDVEPLHGHPRESKRRMKITK